jgi:hypothetical protein
MLPTLNPRATTSPPSCRFHVARNGNLFMRDIAQLLVAGLNDLGIAADVVLDGIPVGGDGVVDVIVAPHEYAAVGPGLARDDLDAVVARSVLLTTEQPHSSWWTDQLDLVAQARAVLDINVVGCWEFEAEGIASEHLQLGYHRSIDAWGGDSSSPRPFDACFLGGETPRRLAALSSVAPVLSHRSSRLLLHDASVPVTEESPWFVTGRQRAELLASSSVLLNVHRDELDYFEWARAIEALANGALLLTERSRHHHPLVPGEHFIGIEVDHLADHLVAVLADDELRRRVTTAAYELLRDDLDLLRSLRRRLDLLVASASSGPPVAPPPVTERAPLRPSSTLPPSEPVQRGLKRAIVGQIALQRRLDRIEARLAGADPDAIEHRVASGWGGMEPDVSVVVPVYGYADTVVAAIESALTSEAVSVEVIVVDDHSPDGARAVIERWMDTHDAAPVRAAFRSSNAGLGAARNLGFELARADACLPLDADNAVYPAGLAKLRAALDGDPSAAFAYGIIEVYGDGRTLLSHLPWSAERLLVRNFLDAMALVRKEAWKAVGGYAEATETSIYGWEDYGFWLAMATHGYHGTLVPEPVFRYRRHGGSMIGVTNLDEAGTIMALRRRFPALPWGER